jgi:hypothetical protein
MLKVSTVVNRMRHNVLGIAEGGVLKAQMFNLAQRYIKCTNVRFSTSAPLLAIPC